MDLANRQAIKRNEKLIRSLDTERLEPSLRQSRIFTNSMLKDIYNPDSEYDLYSELPTRGPKAFEKFVQVMIEAGYENEVYRLKDTSMFTSEQKCGEYKGKYIFYPMKSKPLGCCLIINNIRFDALKDREGSDVDAKKLRNLFERLGYTVEEETNLKGKEMRECLKDFSKSDLLKSVSCCFIVILSHGGKLKNSEVDIIYGTDGKSVPKRDIYAIFNHVNCKNLINKPKIFLFQACRGEDEDEGVYSTESTDSAKFTKLPSISDVMVVHSSLPDHKAYRDHYLGSWLVQDLVSVLKERYLYETLHNMLLTVSRKVQERISLKGEKKQVIHTESFGVNAELYLCSNDEYKGCDVTDRSYI